MSNQWLLEYPNSFVDTAVPSALADDWSTIRSVSVGWLPPACSTTVVVPHPDDEALMFAGVIAHQRQRNLPVHVICVTDGESAYPGADSTALASRRRAEQRDSLCRLGADLGDVSRLGLPDGKVAGAEEVIVDAIVRTESELILAPWRFDHHCDHEACGSAASAAALTTGAQLFEGIFWGWHHTSSTKLDGGELFHFALSPTLHDAKRDAIGFHTSQLMTDYGTPILSVDSLVPSTWTHEYYVGVRS